MANVATLDVGDVIYGPGEERIGTITDVIPDEATLQPVWYEVKVGVFGGRHLLPAGQVVVESDRLVVPYGKDRVKAAPNASGVVPLETERERLFQHYQRRP